MTLPLKDLKVNLRKVLREKRSNLPPEQRQRYSSEIVKYVFQYILNNFPSEQSVELLLFRSLPDEVDISPLFNESCFRVFVPRMLEGERMEWLSVTPDTTWKKVQFGVEEPVSGQLWQPSEIPTVMLTPLLGFDRFGHRLGMGKGYYDRWLQTHAYHLDRVVGIAFSCQEVPKVPVEKHDAPLAAIITENGVIECPSS